MNKYSLNEMIRGWFCGNFEPSIIKSKNFEVGIKRYKAGDKEESHYHKLAQEITVIVAGHVRMNGVEYGPDDIVVIGKFESTDFEALTDAVTCVVRDGSFAGDKYLGNYDRQKDLDKFRMAFGDEYYDWHIKHYDFTGSGWVKLLEIWGDRYPEPEDNQDEHTERCCIIHGCKYGDDEWGGCSVVSKEKVQSHICMDCDDEISEKGTIDY